MQKISRKKIYDKIRLDFAQRHNLSTHETLVLDKQDKRIVEIVIYECEKHFQLSPNEDYTTLKRQV